LVFVFGVVCLMLFGGFCFWGFCWLLFAGFLLVFCGGVCLVSVFVVLVGFVFSIGFLCIFLLFYVVFIDDLLIWLQCTVFLDCSANDLNGTDMFSPIYRFLVEHVHREANMLCF